MVEWAALLVCIWKAPGANSQERGFPETFVTVSQCTMYRASECVVGYFRFKAFSSCQKLEFKPQDHKKFKISKYMYLK